MNKKYSLLFFIVAALIVFGAVYGCERDYVFQKTVSKSLTEEFDTVANMYQKGWVFVNNSKPQGAATWQQGVWVSGKFGPDGFPAFSYKASGDEYIFAGFQSGSDISTISSWMITPILEMKNGDKVSFYTRTADGSQWPDRLQVRLNITDNSSDVGNTATSVGKFTKLIGEINENLAVHGYPERWERFEYTISGLPGTIKGRIGLRYFVTDGGGQGINSNMIGIDLFKFDSQ